MSDTHASTEASAPRALVLHTFFNSSTSYRVRIAMALKGLAYESRPVNLRAGEQRADPHRELNPSQGVPVLIDGDLKLSQAFAIIDYLDHIVPEPRLVPTEQPLRARVLEFSSGIGSDIHPLNNLRVLGYLKKELGASEEQRNTWYAHWIAEGLRACEVLLARHGCGAYCFGDAPTLADCCLVPQVANAQRMKCDVDVFERVMAVYRHAIAQPAFMAASPARQLDFSA